MCTVESVCPDYGVGMPPHRPDLRGVECAGLTGMLHQIELWTPAKRVSEEDSPLDCGDPCTE